MALIQTPLTTLGHFRAILIARKKLPSLLAIILAFLLFCYTFLRAWLLSITHDEAGSFLIWRDFDLTSCYANPDCWKTGNLHWLYVFLMKPAIALFGSSELAIRLPALLGHLIYLFFSFKLIQLILGPSNKDRNWLLLLGFILLNTNPYLLDFFSLARGYGLAMAMMMASLFYLCKWIRRNGLSDLFATLAFAVLAVLSNFTLLLYLASLVASITAIHILSFKDPQRSRIRSQSLASVVILTGTLGMLTWLIYRPISLLSQNNEFQWGPDFFYDTIFNLVKNSLYGAKYIKQYNVETAEILLGSMVALALFKAVQKIIKAPSDPENRIFMTAVSLPLITAAASVAQHYLTGAQYLVNRTSLLFIPMLALVLFLFFKQLTVEKNPVLKILPACLTVLFCLFHLLSVSQLWYTREWTYDSRTKDMLAYVENREKKHAGISLGVYWIYHPSSTYYLETGTFTFARQPLKYSKSLLEDDWFDYYYVEPVHTEQLKHSYEVEKCFDGGGCLMKRK